jgi:uroporphyrinogen decarboxylase
VNRLGVPDPTIELRYVLDTVAQVRRALAGRVPLIGFSGSPFTLACYMVEGRSGTDFMHLKRMLYEEPALLHRLLAVNTAAVATYLQAQIAHGAQVLMLFDTWGGVLTTQDYADFSLAYLREVLARLPSTHHGEPIPKIVFTRGGGLWLERIAACGCDAVGLDWTIDLGEARRRVHDRVALQGNMDPAVLLGSPEAVANQARRVLQAYGHGSGHVFNLGHGILRTTPPENVHALVEAVHTGSRPYHL